MLPRSVHIIWLCFLGGATAGLNDVIGCLLDWDEGAISFTKNGTSLEAAFKIPPALKVPATFSPAIFLKYVPVLERTDAESLPACPAENQTKHMA